MIKFDEQKQLDSVAGALAIRKEIEGIAADVAGRGYKNICYLGIGGTYASVLQTQNHVQEYSGMEIIAQNAALYNTTGNRRIGKDKVFISGHLQNDIVVTKYARCLPPIQRDSHPRIALTPNHSNIPARPHIKRGNPVIRTIYGFQAGSFGKVQVAKPVIPAKQKGQHR